MAPASGERTVVIRSPALRSVGAFAAVPTKIVRNASLSLGARLTYCLLLTYAWQEDFCYPAQTRLATDLGITERQVRRFLIELRGAAYITWRQQGLNLPNRYYILQIEPSTAGSPAGDNGRNESPDQTDMSDPDRTIESGQERTRASAYEEAADKVAKERASDRQAPPEAANDRKARSKPRPSAADDLSSIISDHVLRVKYNLTDQQIGRVHWLVERQCEILGERDRNLRHYVQRAAEAVRDRRGDLLDHKLGDFKQAARQLNVISRPAYFQAMYAEALTRGTA